MDGAKGGRRPLPLLVLPLLLLLHVVALSRLAVATTAMRSSSPRCRFFNFGDSNSDTGGLKAGVGFPMGPPHGYLFFGRSTGRWSDGRLYIDFLCQGLQMMSFLSPYLEALGSDFTIGANFAVAGARTQPKAVPFSLYIQVQQFQHFKNRTKELMDLGARYLIPKEGFEKAIYSIDIGQNDMSTAFYSNFTHAQVIDSIPPVLSEIESAIQTLYANGARKFLVHNTGPFGCMPQTLARNKKDDSELDANGCLTSFNAAARAFNAGLRDLCDGLRSELSDAVVVHVDMYAIKYDLIANHTRYGFERPLMACCGYGGPPYNYRVGLTCGQPNTNICEKGSRFISWDGVHYAEAANAIIAAKILSGAYSTPAIRLDHLCTA